MKNDPLVIRPFDKATDIAPLSAVWFDASLAAHPFLGRARLLEQRKLIEDSIRAAEAQRGAPERARARVPQPG